MGLFKDLKEDFSQAVNELVPGGETPESKEAQESAPKTQAKPEQVAVSEEKDAAAETELSKLDGLLEQMKESPVSEKKVEVKEEKTVMDTPITTPVAEQNSAVADETSVITESTVIVGDLSSAGSFDVQGTINGNIACNGKLVVTGTVNGNSTSSEFFADVAKIEGEVVSTGTVKVGAGSVIIGNITATSAVIAGAVKGDIDVQGPVVVDASAVIMGNIKSRSVQINNGAVIEGFCSQAYADIDVQELFEKR